MDQPCSHLHKRLIHSTISQISISIGLPLLFPAFYLVAVFWQTFPLTNGNLPMSRFHLCFHLDVRKWVVANFVFNIGKWEFSYFLLFQVSNLPQKFKNVNKCLWRKKFSSDIVYSFLFRFAFRFSGFRFISMIYSLFQFD